MDHQTFDQLARAVARSGPTRRGLLRGALGLGLAAFVGGRARTASAGPPAKMPLCHLTGDPENPYVIITVPEPAWETHFSHGDMPYVDCCVDADCASGLACVDGVCMESAECADDGTACDDRECGTAVNNCGETVTCGDCPPSDACITYSCFDGVCFGGKTVCPITSHCAVASCDPALGCVNTPVPAGEQGTCPNGSVCSGDGTCVDILSDPANCGALGNACAAPDPCTPAACLGGVCTTASACPADHSCLRARDCSDYTCENSGCSFFCPCPRVGPFGCFSDSVVDTDEMIRCEGDDGLPV